MCVPSKLSFKDMLDKLPPIRIMYSGMCNLNNKCRKCVYLADCSREDTVWEESDMVC
jgi:hypothetical protein